MGVEMWFPDDVGRILYAVARAANGVLANVPDSPEARAFLAGQDNALRAVAQAFGVPWPGSSDRAERQR